jgi:hypothetical protein
MARPTIVVCLSSGLISWGQELLRHAPGIEDIAQHGGE